jgi:hypothetical protein
VPMPLDDVDVVAHQSATTTVSSLLADPTTLEQVRVQAIAIRLELDMSEET